jgi:3-mercaptopyruvate sulfurtransferase SseA
VRQQLVKRGFGHVRVLSGGLPAWKREQLPLEQLYPELEKQLRQKTAAK